MIELIEEGVKHILDIKGYDHLLFLLVLVSPYRFRNLKKILLLVTAFTIGHAITLAFTALDYFYIPGHIIELLIPITIMITALSYTFFPRWKNNRPILTYLIVIFFGLIHGMGFSSYFKMISNKENILSNLLGFNIGIELGQIIIILTILTLNVILLKIPGITQRYWTYYINYIGIMLSGYLIWGQVN